MSEPADKADRERLRKQKIQRQLDEALADSFPASDPVSRKRTGAAVAQPPLGPRNLRRRRPSPRALGTAKARSARARSPPG
jgi:hypothetical protein